MAVVNPSTLQARISAAVDALKAKLLPLVLGQERAAFECRCEKFHNGHADAVDIVFPSLGGVLDEHIGAWRNWTVALQEIGHVEPSVHMPLAEFVPLSTLYPLFREAFENIGIPVLKPFVDIRSGRQALSSTFSRRRGFTPGVDVITVSANSSTLLRSTDEPDATIWVNGLLNVKAKGHDAEPTITFEVDPFGRHFESHLDDKRYSGGEIGAESRLTVYVSEGEEAQSARVPVVRLIGYDSLTGAHTFELAEGVAVAL